jgi:hypothetical protein
VLHPAAMVAVGAATLSESAQERLLRTRIVERYALARTIVRSLCLLGIGWLMAHAAGDFAGRVTSVNVSAALSLIADLKFVATLTLAGGAGSWAFIERKLRHRKVDYLQERIRDLETRRDPQRSSSGLMTTGQTNPQDRRK